MDQREDKGSDDKTEDPTDEKRNQFREEGNVANPREIVAAAVLIFFTLYFYFRSGNIMESFQLSFQRSWMAFKPQDINSENLLNIIYYSIEPSLNHIIIIFFLCIIIPLLIGLLFTKFNFSLKKLSFDLDKLNPANGIMRIFGIQTLTELLKVFVKFTAISVIIIFVIRYKIMNSNHIYFLGYFEYLKEIGSSIFTLLSTMSVAVIIVGIGDYAFNFFKIENELKMTKQELKEDVKKHEGDPQMKSRRKRLAREYVFKKSLKDVPKATFIVTNPEHFSIAIRYLKGMNAPVVIAKGQDLMAFKIREIAKKNDIIIVENKPLARTLYKTTKIGQEVPATLYQAIIEVMKYIYKLKGKNYFEKIADNERKQMQISSQNLNIV